ncbi:MAG: arginine--tRNA ligase [Thermoguttaceae bacterium]|nr:arginine--tRNA ligase [Thermoguttaceae bacterium]MDW8077937.1 arginine--tRNA ligase [Thermoguttaceae bacterium]
MSLLTELRARFAVSLESLGEDPKRWIDQVRPAQSPEYGDYQANLAMCLAKRFARSPRQLAHELLARTELGDLCDRLEIAGPGFINMRIRDEVLEARLTQSVHDPRLGIPLRQQTETFVVDYSAPNVAKPMHVGHIRSTVIGDAICRMLRFVGHRVISDNHIGDWGTQFGMIIYGWRHFADRTNFEKDPLGELGRLYRLVNELAEKDPAVAQAVQTETAKLHAGDPENRQLWQQFMPICLQEIESIYRRLGVTFDYTLGESFYHDRLPALVEDLRRRGIAQESEGAVCIFLEGFKAPMIIRKRDGAFLYATTDLATLIYRMETWQPDWILYVVDHRQSLHFQQLFAAARLLGYDKVKLVHVSFGTVLGEDGRPFRTRSGETVPLEALLDEAVARARKIVDQNDEAKPNGPELSEEERARIAEVVGIGALKYADLSQNRTSDYVFSFDKMLAMNGNTGAYMQYAYARVRSIFAKAGLTPEEVRARDGSITLKTTVERRLGLGILRFAEAIDLALEDFRPNLLTNYLFELATLYSTFYETCPVLQAETPELRQSRLLLCDLTARTIQKGLELLGIGVVERM